LYVEKYLSNWINCYTIEVEKSSVTDVSENVYFDEGCVLHDLYGAKKAAIYLIRPDGYIAFRSQPVHLDKFKEYWKTHFSV